MPRSAAVDLLSITPPTGDCRSALGYPTSNDADPLSRFHPDDRAYLRLRADGGDRRAHNRRTGIDVAPLRDAARRWQSHRAWRERLLRGTLDRPYRRREAACADRQ